MLRLHYADIWLKVLIYILLSSLAEQRALVAVSINTAGALTTVIDNAPAGEVAEENARPARTMVENAEKWDLEARMTAEEVKKTGLCCQIWKPQGQYGDIHAKVPKEKAEVVSLGI